MQRRAKPSHVHPTFNWLPIVVTDDRMVAKWEAGGTVNRAWVWEQPERGAGWLLCKWEGLDVDYGHVVSSCTLPDGTTTGFHHRGTVCGGRTMEERLAISTWFSSKEIPPRCEELGVRSARHRSTVDQIVQTERYAFADRYERGTRGESDRVMKMFGDLLDRQARLSDSVNAMLAADERMRGAE